MNAAAETFLVVVDGTDECEKALRFAALRAQHTGARLKLLHVLAPAQFLQWGGVQEAMEAETEALAKDLLAGKAADVESLTGRAPDTLIRKGKAGEVVLDVLKSDPQIRALVLAAAARGRPGPLVEFFAGERAGSLPCMVMIVPGGIDNDALDRLT